MKLQKTRKAFTLIELMIVIAIIGLLAVSLFPQLQGAQERSRDAARLSNIKNVVAVLETYYYDEGVYPTNSHDADVTANGDACLSTADGSVTADLQDLFKGGKAPLDPQKSSKAGECNTDASIGYYSLSKDSINDNGYMLVTDIETEKKANYDWADAGGASIAKDGSTAYETYVAKIDQGTDAYASGKDSVYVEMN